MKKTISLVAILGFFTLPNIAFSQGCSDFPNYCRATAILSGQPKIDSTLGLRVMSEISRLENTITSEQLQYLIEQSQKKTDAVNERVMAARQRVNSLLIKSNSANRLGKLAGYLKTIATLASVADEILKFTGTLNPTPKAKDEDASADGAEAAAVPGSTTYFGKLNEELALSKEARSRVETLLSEDYGGRYFAVKAILRRLKELGSPTTDNLSDAPIEQEILLSKAYAILAGWSATDADETFENFSFELDSIDDLLDDASKVSPLALFAEITFQSQPVGDGTVFSINNVPGLLSELEPYAMDTLRWRDPLLFPEATVQPPWLSD
jgi:hypothetical protein